MGKVIGNAADFYRLRVKRVDVSDEPDLEWRDDILYREPPRARASEFESWALEAVDLDDDQKAVVIAAFDSSDAAHDALNEITEDLDNMTKSRFEERYLTHVDEGA